MEKSSRHVGPARREAGEPPAPAGALDVAAAVRRIRARTRLAPKLAIVLGSGFHAVRQEIQAESTIPYREIPGFVPTTVDGHAGELVFGELAGVAVAVLAGRAHYYEGHALAVVTFPIRVLAALGLETVLLTNAAGAINPRFPPGDFMVIRDHLNLMGANPLRGPAAGGERFVDLSAVYDAGLRRELRRAARRAGVRLRVGVYAAVSGPSYETPAEIRALAGLGADAVGMSTVPEAIVARQCALRVAGLSCLANPAAGRGRGRLSHGDVLAAARRAGTAAGRLLAAWLPATAAGENNGGNGLH